MKADVIEIAEYLINNSAEGLISDALKIPSVEDQIVRLNLSQLAKFQDSEGVMLADIGGEYSEQTQKKKGAGPRDVNLRDTGEYWSTFRETPVSGGYEIDSNPLKGDENLLDKYGEDVEGLQKKNIDKADGIIENQVWKTAEEKV